MWGVTERCSWLRKAKTITCADPYIMEEIWNSKIVLPLLEKRINRTTIQIPQYQRGHVKQALIKLGFPVQDIAGYAPGTPLEINLRDITLSGMPFELRDYQEQAVDAFYAGGSLHGGSGVIVLPCGAGKTIVGIGAMEKLQCETLILSTNITAVRQWISEICDKTTIPESAIGEYTGELKEVKPVTVTTYQILTYRKSKSEDFRPLQ
jgi:DNA excision repair protein ERCC-3